MVDPGVEANHEVFCGQIVEREGTGENRGTRDRAQIGLRRAVAEDRAGREPVIVVIVLAAAADGEGVGSGDSEPRASHPTTVAP